MLAVLWVNETVVEHPSAAPEHIRKNNDQQYQRCVQAVEAAAALEMPLEGPRRHELGHATHVVSSVSRSEKRSTLFNRCLAEPWTMVIAVMPVHI